LEGGRQPPFLISPDGEPWTLETFTAGVETTGVWSIVDFSRIEQSLRMDGEYYQPLYLHYANITLSGETLETNTAITHPIEIKRVYEKSGVQILLAQNIRYNRLDFSTVVYMPLSVVNQISRNKLSVDDVVMTRSGANFGDAAVYKGVPSEIYACADCLIIRPRDIPGGYLSTYLNTKIGRALLTRGAYGMAQPHIAPNYLYTMRLPRFGDDFEQEIDKLVVQAYELEGHSKTLYCWPNWGWIPHRLPRSGRPRKSRTRKRPVRCGQRGGWTRSISNPSTNEQWRLWHSREKPSMM